ncbi:unnamed protein product [Urochloa decumbens]|uniref:F-box domain-containing protein n=1 Tax=Urochloa decumbens TaxID=240449 RepID=A0ABC8VTK4_9POAL
MAQIPPGPGARAPPSLPSHLMEEILVRVATPRDLARASAACATFRRLVADASFLRRYRSLHPPLLLGFIDAPYGFTAVEAPHPNAPTAGALARAADFSFERLGGRGSGWYHCDARDGRVLLMCYGITFEFLLPEFAVWDPLTRGHTLHATTRRHNSGNKLLKLEVNRMEFSAVSLPPNHENRQSVVVEAAGEGNIGILSHISGQEIPEPLRYSIRQNEGENANEHVMETTIPLPSDYDNYRVVAAGEGYIFLLGSRSISQQGTVVLRGGRLAFFTLEIKTLKIERVCSIHGGVCGHILPYFGFPTFMSPRRI